MAKKASQRDIFNRLSSLNYKTVPQIEGELKSRGFKTNRCYLHEPVYSTLKEWVNEGIVESRLRSPADHISIDGYVWILTKRGSYKATSLPLPEGKPNCLLEYRKIGNLRLEKEGRIKMGGLELGLSPA